MEKIVGRYHNSSPLMKFWAGNVFTGVCNSVHRGTGIFGPMSFGGMSRSEYVQGEEVGISRENF